MQYKWIDINTTNMPVNFKNETGKRYGKLVVTSKFCIIKKNKQQKTIWWCKCDCGSYKAMVGVYLRVGDTQSCGCLRRQRNRQFKGNDYFTGSLISRYRLGAKQRDLYWPGDKEICEWSQEIADKQGGKCNLCGIYLQCRNTKNTRKGGNNGISIDRIDSNRGYYKDNIQMVCSMCQKMKWDFTQKDFINKCKLVSSYN